MLRSLPRAAHGSSLRGTSIRTTPRLPSLPISTCMTDLRHQQTRSAAVHAISNPTLAQIEKRWEEMPPQEQADLWMALRDRMKNDWHELTLQERKAGKLISMGTLWAFMARSIAFAASIVFTSCIHSSLKARYPTALPPFEKSFC